MTLLITPEQVKRDSATGENERRKRLASMAEEEARLIRVINDLRAAEQVEKDAIRERVATTRNVAQTEIGQIEF